MTPTDKRALSLYGDKAEVVGLTNRLLSMMPGGKKLDKTQAMTLAQISIAHGLDPFNGEAWYIPGSGVMVGIKGLRKLARRQAEKEGGKGSTFWTQFDRAVMPAEYGAGDEDIVFLCNLRDDVTLTKYVGFLEKLVDMGYDGQAAREMIGAGPITEGIGIYKDGEKTKMDKVKVAKKRAEADAIKQRYDVEFLVFDEEHDIDPGFDPGTITFSDGEEDVVEAEVVERKEDVPPSIQEALKIRREITALINKHSNKTASDQFRNMLAGSLNRLLGGDVERYDVTEFLFGQKSTKDIDSPKVYAINDWMSSQKPQIVEERMGMLLEGVRANMELLEAKDG